MLVRGKVPVKRKGKGKGNVLVIPPAGIDPAPP
jgi:hypothetical protein